MTFDLSKCKPFNREAAARGEKVVTCEGLPYVYGGFNPHARTEGERIAGWINGSLFAHFEDGRYEEFETCVSEYDLFMAPKVREVWVRVAYRTGGPVVVKDGESAEELNYPLDDGVWLGPAIKHGEVEE